MAVSRLGNGNQKFTKLQAAMPSKYPEMAKKNQEPEALATEKFGQSPSLTLTIQEPTWESPEMQPPISPRSLAVSRG
jgi:hypothetical protein